ncbi:MAG: hypothetical protein WBL33_02860, partial [Candidatus Acidiferrales bacterium]
CPSHRNCEEANPTTENEELSHFFPRQERRALEECVNHAECETRIARIFLATCALITLFSESKL